MSDQNRCTTSCSLKPVNRNVEKSTRSAGVQASKNFLRSASPYSRGRLITRSGSPRFLVTPAFAVALQELRHDDHLVDHGVVVELVLALEPHHEVGEIVARDLPRIGVRRKELDEAVEHRFVFPKRVRFLERLDRFEVVLHRDVNGRALRLFLFGALESQRPAFERVLPAAATSWASAAVPPPASRLRLPRSYHSTK